MKIKKLELIVSFICLYFASMSELKADPLNTIDFFNEKIKAKFYARHSDVGKYRPTIYIYRSNIDVKSRTGLSSKIVEVKIEDPKGIRLSNIDVILFKTRVRSYGIAKNFNRKFLPRRRKRLHSDDDLQITVFNKKITSKKPLRKTKKITIVVENSKADFEKSRRR